MKKRLFILALVVVMMMSFVVPVYADYYVFDTLFMFFEEGVGYREEPLSGNYSGNGWAWNGSDKVLTLNSANEEKTMSICNSSEPVTIKVNGDNKLYYLDHYDVYDDQEDLFITGSGTLEISSLFGQDIYCNGPDIKFTSQAIGTYIANKGTLYFEGYADPAFPAENPIGGGTYVIDLGEVHDPESNNFYELTALSFEVGSEYNPMPEYFKDLSFEDENGKPVSFVVKTQEGTYSDGEYYVAVKEDGSFATYVKITNPNHTENEPDPTPTPSPDPEPTPDPDDGATENPFVDVDQETGSWYYDAVLWAVENNVTSGTSDTTFSPTMKCTRAQVCTFLWKEAGQPAPQTENAFSDVKEGAWYYDAVLWAVEEGITDGTGGGKFSPDTECSRAQIATFLWKAAGKPKVVGENIFEDIPDDTWYSDAVMWAAMNEITTGTGGNKFTPDMTIDRAQFVTFLYRFKA